MKKLILAAVLTLLIAGTAFATEIKVNPTAVHNFQREFKNVSEVKWETFRNYTLAAFMQNGTTAKAYYDEKGELFGISRHIMQEDLALNIKRALAKHYNGYTVKEAIKFEGGEGTAYFLVAENDKYKSVLKVVDGQLSLYKKELKSK